MEVVSFSKIALAMGLLLRDTALIWGHDFLISMFSIVPLSPGVPVCAAWFCSPDSSLVSS